MYMCRICRREPLPSVPDAYDSIPGSQSNQSTPKYGSIARQRVLLNLRNVAVAGCGGAGEVEDLEKGYLI